MKTENLINSVLSLDPHTQSQLEKLNAKTLAVTITDYHLTFYVIIENNRIRLQKENLEQVDAEFSASSWNFISVLRNKKAPYWELTKKINTKGDMDFIQDIHNVLQHLHIDWEEYLSFVFGDVITQKLSSWGRKFTSWWEQIKTRNQINLVEYLHYEKNYLPSREETQEFFNDIRQLNYDVDRLEANLHFFEKKQAMDE
jgi:ubiquinone biosynthesis protein UbiJ